MKLHTLTAVAALVLAGSFATAQAQTTQQPVQPSTQGSPSDKPTHPTTDGAKGQATTPSTQGSPTTPPTSPSTAGPGGAGGQMDEAGAIAAAREKCKSSTDAQAQQNCMKQAQQDFERSKGSGQMQGEPGMKKDSSGSTGQPATR